MCVVEKLIDTGGREIRSKSVRRVRSTYRDMHRQTHTCRSTDPHDEGEIKSTGGRFRVTDRDKL